MNRAILALVIAALASAGIARAADAPPTAPELAAYPDSTTAHTITLGGKPVAYTARAGMIAIKDDRGVVGAQMFYTAYTLDGAPAATRPITFIYNGGPGSSTMWLRMGSIGPVRVQVAPNAAPNGGAPYHITDNSSTLLDKSDLVFIDMPSTGFGRIVPGKEKEYYGVDQDASAFGQFITNYLSEFNRWNSPKFLFGESYGTTRSAALANVLFNRGVALNGITLVSSILNFGLDLGNGAPIGGGDWGYVIYLPTEAATAWYHHKAGSGTDLASFVQQARQFATGQYLDALYAGDKISPALRDDTVRKLSYFLGLSPQYIRNANLRVYYDRFERELLRGQGIVIGRLDGRYQTWELDRASLEGPNWDPTDSSIDAPFTTAINYYLRNDLKYSPPQPYRPNAYGIIYSGDSSWDFSHNGRYPTNVAPDLAEVMAQNPKMKVFSANGYYDFATPFFATEYTLKHLNLNPGLESNISYGFYEAGHMVYLPDSAVSQFHADLDRFYDSATGQ